MARKIIGLDVGTHSVAAVKVVCRGRDVRIEAQARLPVVPAADGGDGLAETLARLAEAVDPAGCICAAAIPANLAVFRNLSVPFDSPRKIRQVLPFELEPSLPYAVDDVTIGFRTLAPAPAEGPTPLVAGAVENDRLAAYLEALTAAGFRPESLSVGGYAAARWVAAHRPDGDALLVDVRQGFAAMFALSRGEVALVRAFATGGDPAHTLNVLCTRVRQTGCAMADLLPHPFEPAAVMVVGDGGSVALSALGDALGLPAERCRFITDTVAPPQWADVPLDNALALALTRAAGLDGIDFQPRAAGFKRLWSENRAALTRTGVLAGLLLVLALVGALTELYGRQRRLDGLHRQMTAVFTDTFPEVRAVVDPLQQMRIKVREARRASGGVAGLGTRMPAVEVLRQLSVNLPGDMDIDLSQLMIAPDSLLIAGSTDGFNAVDRIKSLLGRIDGFKSVNITSATVEKVGGRVRFRLSIEL